MKYTTEEIQKLRLIANRIRQETIRMTFAAQSGHPGGSLSEADMIAALYFHVMHIDPERPDWPDRDRFLLSKGHACPGLYAVLALRGYFPIEILSSFRQYGSILQGHPDMNKTLGVEMTSGPLGNGLGAGAGMALGGRMSGRDFRVYVMLGDGDNQEGATWEAAMFAGYQKLSNLTCLIDYNRSQVDGPTMKILDLDPLPEKWLSFNWGVKEIDGHNIPQILDALAWAKSYSDGPQAIIAHTIKGKGVSFMEDQYVWHGKPPNKEQADQALAELSAEVL